MFSCFTFKILHSRLYLRVHVFEKNKINNKDFSILTQFVTEDVPSLGGLKAKEQGRCVSEDECGWMVD